MCRPVRYTYVMISNLTGFFPLCTPIYTFLLDEKRREGKRVQLIVADDLLNER